MRPVKDMLWPTFKKMEFLFNTAYYVVYLKLLLIFIFPHLCSLQRKNGLSLGNTCIHIHVVYIYCKSIMADGATDISCVEEEIVSAGLKMTTLQLRKESLKKNCKSCIYNCDNLLSYNSPPRNSHNDFHYIHHSYHPFVGLKYNEPIQRHASSWLVSSIGKSTAPV